MENAMILKIERRNIGISLMTRRSLSKLFIHLQSYNASEEEEITRRVDIFDRYLPRFFPPLSFLSTIFHGYFEHFFLGRDWRKILELSSRRCFSSFLRKAIRAIRPSLCCFFLAIFLRAESFSPSNGARSFIYVQRCTFIIPIKSVQRRRTTVRSENTIREIGLLLGMLKNR